VRGRLSAGVARAREMAALMREGAIDGLSIGFRVVEADRDRGSGLRRLRRLDLWEVSIVTFPMQPGARVQRSASPAPTAPRRGEVESRSGRVRGRLAPGEGAPPHPSPLPDGEREPVSAAPLALAIRRATLRLSTTHPR